MTMEVLGSMADVRHARREMRRRKLSFAAPRWLEYLRARGLVPGISVGDDVKSWDVLKTVDFAKRRLRLDDPILDIGAYASEVLCVLHRLGFTRLTGVDLNPRLMEMPYAETVEYAISDFMNTPFADASFRMITAVSVIEHGFEPARLLHEVSRLLRPGGYFVASFDYWPEKIDTAGIRMFDMDWKIFSREEVASFVAQAAEFGLRPVGELRFDAGERPIRCAGKHYTFAWLALERASPGTGID